MSVSDNEPTEVVRSSVRVDGLLRRASVAVLIAGLLLLPGCGGGGGGGDDSDESTCLEFTQSAAPADGTVVARVAAGSTCDTLVIELVIQQVDDVFGVSFEASFESDVVTYDGWSTTGTILDPPSVFLDPPIPDGIQLGVSRTGLGVNVGATPQVLLRLMFSKGSRGSTPFIFSSADVQDAGPPPDNIPGIGFFGGVLDVS